jgi:iron(III) transport system permease protein
MLVSVWLAYAVVWLACGTQIARGSIEKLDPELEDIARTVGATQARARLDVTLPLLRNSVLAAWLLIFLMFVRDYSTAIYLIAAGNEIAGPLLVSLWAEGSMDLVSALSVIMIAILGTGALSFHSAVAIAHSAASLWRSAGPQSVNRSEQRGSLEIETARVIGIE